MENKYFAVTVKAGHVGRNNYIIKTLAIRAESGKEAAYIARWKGRVKHHDKKAILNVEEVSMEDYYDLKKKNDDDLYFSCTSRQEQNRLCQYIKESIRKEERKDNDFDSGNREGRIEYKMKKNKILLKECLKMRESYVYNY